MTDDDEFDHMVENSQRVLRLNAQYKNHPYVEEFTKECNVTFIYGTYVLEGETDAKFSLGDPLPNNTSNFCRQMIDYMRAQNYLQKTSDLPLRTEIVKQTHKIMMEHRDGKDVLIGEYRKNAVFSGFKTFAPASAIARLIKKCFAQILQF